MLDRMGGGEDLFGLVGKRLDGKYDVEAVVAMGGFGVVYRARHTTLLTWHAVKVLRIPGELPAEMHARFLKQFADEARIIAQFQHPAVVRVSDFGASTMPTGEESPWMVLEWIEGITLAEHLKSRRGQGGRSPQECLDLLSPVIDALAAAHEMGIAHRDIKPGNIMLANDLQAASKRGALRPAARVLDFGIAKLMSAEEDGPSSGQTNTLSLMSSFSPRYAAPEQASGTRTGPWTDVHALGLVLTEMLTDRAPYDPADKLQLTMQVMSPSRPTPAHFGVDVGGWEPVLARALALTPSARFANAGELLTALESSVSTTRSSAIGEPSSAPRKRFDSFEIVTVRDVSTLRPSILPRVATGTSFNRRTMLVFLVVLGAGVAGVINFAWYRSKRSPTGAVAQPASQPIQDPPTAPSTIITPSAPPSAPSPTVEPQHTVVAPPHRPPAGRHRDHRPVRSVRHRLPID